MNDEPKNETVPQREGDNKVPKETEDQKELTEFEKLKASNDEFEKELIRSRELKAESQKLQAEKMMAGEAGGRIEPKPISQEQMEQNNRVRAVGMAGGAQWAKDMKSD